MHFGTFLCRPLQNNNVKWPNSRFYGEREFSAVNFPCFFFESRPTNSAPTLHKLNELELSRISSQNASFIFRWRFQWRRPPRYLRENLSSDDGDGNAKENVSWKYIYFICVTSRLFQLVQILQKRRTIQGPNWLGWRSTKERKIKNSATCVRVLHKTLNMLILRCCFAEDGKEMYHNLKRTCRAIVFAH